MTPEQNLINDCITKVITDPNKAINAQRKLGIPIVLDKTPHTLITLQYSEKKVDDREKQLNLISLLSTFKWFKNSIYHYSFEYFSKIGVNPHIHILLRPKDCILNKTKILRDLNRKLKSITKTINYLPSSSKEHYLNRLKYITNKPESEFTILDHAQRQKLNFAPYYTNATQI